MKFNERIGKYVFLRETGGNRSSVFKDAWLDEPERFRCPHCDTNLSLHVSQSETCKCGYKWSALDDDIVNVTGELKNVEMDGSKKREVGRANTTRMVSELMRAEQFEVPTYNSPSSIFPNIMQVAKINYACPNCETRMPLIRGWTHRCACDLEWRRDGNYLEVRGETDLFVISSDEPGMEEINGD